MKKLFRRLVSALLLISAFAPSIQALDKPSQLYIIGNLQDDEWCQNGTKAAAYKMTATTNGFSINNVTFANSTSYFRFAADHKTDNCNQYGRKDGEGPYSTGNGLTSTNNCFTIPAGTYNVVANFTNETITLTPVGGGGGDDPVVENCDGWYIKLNGDQGKQVHLENGNTIAKWTGVELHNGSNTNFYIQIWDGQANKD